MKRFLIYYLAQFVEIFKEWFFAFDFLDEVAMIMYIYLLKIYIAQT